MDMSSPTPVPVSWFTELDVEDPMLELVGDWLVDYPLEDFGVAALDKDLYHTHSSGSECNSSTTAADIINTSGAKRQKVIDHQPWSPMTIEPDKPDDHQIKPLASPSISSSNDNSSNNNNSNAESGEKSSLKRVQRSSSSPSLEQQGGTTSKRPKRQPDQCHNHIIAERQRRQNLSQGFIALSALIPGLKKMDKTSVLGEAISHMKQLKGRLKVLEDESSKRAVESVVVVKRSRVIDESDTNFCSDNNQSSNNNNNNSQSQTSCVDDQLPEIEARICDKSVLIKIHCAVQKAILTKIVTQIENLHLSVTTANALSFNGGTLDFTIVAQMESEFEMTPGDVVRDLRSIFR